jgi:hypothetical protein
MSRLLHDLLGIVKVAVISGGDWPQFQQQIVSHLPQDKSLNNLSILPTSGNKFLRYTGDWRELYSEDFTADEKARIIASLRQVVAEAGFPVERVWGELIEGSRLHKAEDDQRILDRSMPGFSVRLRGATSIDGH